MDDGRILEGTLECIDRLRNILLRDAKESRDVEDESIYQCSSSFCDAEDDTRKATMQKIKIERRLPQALIPGNRLKRVYII